VRDGLRHSESAGLQGPSDTCAAERGFQALIAGIDVAARQHPVRARQGLHVTIEPIASSQAVIAEQLKGQVDVSAGSYIPYIAAQAAGASFRVLAEASMLRPDTRVLVTTAHSSIVTVAQPVGKKIAVNGTNSIGTLLIGVLLSDHGISPAKVRLITDPQGFPAMPARLQEGAWAAAFLAEPYITFAGEQYGDRILADLDRGSAVNFPIDGYVATTAWTQSTRRRRPRSSRRSGPDNCSPIPTRRRSRPPSPGMTTSGP
jgi:ABC-type nitrate/sulfonate/bicarbonate transport system substrate-binding protein